MTETTPTPLAPEPPVPAPPESLGAAAAIVAPETPEAPPAPAAVCPIPLSVLPPSVHKSLDPKSPLPVRMMAAKGLVPLGPKDLLTALYLLTFDPDPKVSETARQSAGKLQDKTLAAALRDEDIRVEILTFYTAALTGRDDLLEIISLNNSTPDDAFVEIARTGSDRLVETIAQNQLRILRDERIVRALVQNPATRPATKDSVLDFCVRSGVVLHELPEYVEARRRILGEDPKLAAQIEESEKITADAVLEQFGDAVKSDEAPPLEEGKRLTFTQQVLRMSVSQKIKLASRGNKEARTILLRDSNKLVALAAIQSPRMTEGEIIMLSSNRTLHDDVMRFITSNRDWLKNYKVKLNLVNNPKSPQAVSLKLMHFLEETDLKTVARNKNVPSVIQSMARKMVADKARK